jgi:hypothetical protein
MHYDYNYNLVAFPIQHFVKVSLAVASNNIIWVRPLYAQKEGSPSFEGLPLFQVTVYPLFQNITGFGGF